ncbi:peptidase, M16 family, partial [Opisthorchis viverrini]
PENEGHYAINTMITDISVTAFCHHPSISAACLCLRFGSFSDPVEMPGCANLLSRGSKTFAGTNSFNAFLQQNNGESGAYCTYEYTTFCFQIGASHLEGALMRFVTLFECPELPEEGIKQALSTMDTEYRKLKICGAVYDYLKFLTEEAGRCLNQWDQSNWDFLWNDDPHTFATYVQELKIVQESRFIDQPVHPAYVSTISLANMMHRVSMEDLYSGYFLVKETNFQPPTDYNAHEDRARYRDYGSLWIQLSKDFEYPRATFALRISSAIALESVRKYELSVIDGGFEIRVSGPSKHI